MLRQVQSDRSNLAHGWLPFAADSIRQQFGTQMGKRPLAMFKPIKSGTSCTGMSLGNRPRDGQETFAKSAKKEPEGTPPPGNPGWLHENPALSPNALKQRICLRL